MEYIKNDLRQIVQSGLEMSPIEIKRMFYSMLLGLKYLHSAKVLHRDIKPANILVDEYLNIKYWDFGLARSIADFEHELENG